MSNNLPLITAASAKSDFAIATTLAMKKSAEITRRTFPAVMKPSPPEGRGPSGGGRTLSLMNSSAPHKLTSSDVILRQMEMLLKSWNTPVPRLPQGHEPTDEEIQERLQKLLVRHVSLMNTFWKFFIENVSGIYEVPLQMFMSSVEECVTAMDKHGTEYRAKHKELVLSQVTTIPANYISKSEFLTSLERVREERSKKERENQELQTQLANLQEEYDRVVDVLKAQSTRTIRKVVGAQGKEADFPRVLWLEKKLDESDKELDLSKTLMVKYKTAAEENQRMYEKLNAQASDAASRMKVMSESIVKLNNKLSRCDYVIKGLEKECERLKLTAAENSKRGGGARATHTEDMIMSETYFDTTLPDVKRRMTIVALGSNSRVPPLLRHTGLVDLIDLTKEQVDAIIEDMWHHRGVAYEAALRHGESTAFSQFAYSYFERRYKGSWSQWAYSVFEATRYFEYDINHYLFRLLVQGDVGELILQEFSTTANAFIDMCDHIDQAVNGDNRKHKIHCKHALNCLVHLFPAAPPHFFAELLERARQFCCTKDNEILYNMLFPILGVPGQDSQGRRMSFGVLHQEGPRILTKETLFSSKFKEGIILDNLTVNSYVIDSIANLGGQTSIKEIRKIILTALDNKVSDYQVDVLLATINDGAMPSTDLFVEIPEYTNRMKEKIVLRKWKNRHIQDEVVVNHPSWAWWRDNDVKELDYESIYLLVHDSALEKTKVVVGASAPDSTKKRK
eukprot:PhF_6_TR11672/c0_g1_i1/m.18886